MRREDARQRNQRSTDVDVGFWDRLSRPLGRFSIKNTLRVALSMLRLVSMAGSAYSVIWTCGSSAGLGPKRVQYPHLAESRDGQENSFRRLAV